MPPIDFRKVEDSKEFPLIPEGRYLARLEQIEVGETKDGAEMWSLWWKITDGKHAGQMIFDRLIFSEASLPRVKLVCSRLGVDVSGAVNLIPTMLRGRKAYVTTVHEKYQGVTRNKVPFKGYESITSPMGDEPAEAAAVSPTIDEGEVPF